MKKYIWRAVIDENTCPQCLERDGMEMDQDEASDLTPPLHGKDSEHPIECRCYLEEKETR